MQDLPSVETIKTWPQLVPGLYWRTLSSSSSTKQTIPARAHLRAHYKAYLVDKENKLEKADGTADCDLASISPNSEPLSFVIGVRSMIPAWDIIFTPTESHSEVHVGDIVEFFANSDLCYGSGGRYAPSSAFKLQFHDSNTYSFVFCINCPP